MTVGVSVLPKGTRGRRHRHPVDEVYLLYAGKALLSKDDKSIIMSPGMAIFIPSNTPHALETLEDTVLVWQFPVPLHTVEYDFS